MSGHSYSSECPNCGKEMNSYNDWKPFDLIEHNCLHCGFYATTKTGYYDLEELNQTRLLNGLNKLNKLPNQDSTWKEED